MGKNMPDKCKLCSSKAMSVLQVWGIMTLVLIQILPRNISAQTPLRIDQDMLVRVMPDATSFSEKIGDPPVYKAFAQDPISTAQTLIGYVFLSSDLPPEEFGYSGSIEVLIGVDLKGTLTGAAVINYYEAHMASKGDFLRRLGVQEQFAGKHVGDAFRIYRDIDGISGSTISMGAMARGIRNSARRVAMAYLSQRTPIVDVTSTSGVGKTSVVLEQLTWLELVSKGFIAKMEIVRYNSLGLDLSFVYVGNEKFGNILMGTDSYTSMIEKVGIRYKDYHLMILGLDGSFISGFQPRALTVLQRGNAYPLARNQVVYWGRPEKGNMAEQVFYSAMLLVDRAVDISQTFTIQYDDRQGGPVTIEYTVPHEILELVQEGSIYTQTDDLVLSDGGGELSQSNTISDTILASIFELESDIVSKPSITSDIAKNAGHVDAAESPTTISEVKSVLDTTGPTGLIFDFTEEESDVSLMLSQTRWSRVVGLCIILGLALYAFILKGVLARWITLAGTLFYLGWVDGGFLSISHITSGIAGGPEVYLADLVMLIMIIFTVVTTLLWGRVFCGFLCPFGALQDFIEWATPKRFQRKVSSYTHSRAIYIKYAILALIVFLAFYQSDISIYGYFEPFGTVFFLSSSVLMWIIAGAILVASIVIPRFYCRYACPLGAALGIASLISIFRIPRIKQCGFCKVCEQHCPTGAISGPEVDFKECVRCNICEVKLLTKAGVCRHDMDDVKSRLVQLQISSSLS
jgi:Na+-translocating ferredoxin:NAD+ oxidoreductase RnfG subunit